MGQINKIGQLKIQEMAFVLLAVAVLFALAFLLYISFGLSSVKDKVTNQEQEKAKESVLKLAVSPELAFDYESCLTCIDFDKAILLKNRTNYQSFWGLEYLKIERVYPRTGKGECSLGNYPNCDSITLIKKSETIGSPPYAFISLCRHESDKGGYNLCELGKLYASGQISRTK